MLKIGAYSVVREVFHDGLIPAFKAQWKSKTGRDVQFEESYSGSGAQARSIASGFDADLAILSHEGDMQGLVKAGKVKSDWNSGPHRGILTHSLVVIGHRAGNPKQIKDWPDLGRPGVGVLYPDPKTSGGARWNINAIYGAALLIARDPAQGPARPGPVSRPDGAHPGQRRQHGPIRPTEHGQFRRTADRRRRGHLRERAPASKQGRRTHPLRDPTFHAPDREPRGDRRDVG